MAIAAILFFILPLSIAPKTILALYLIVSVIAESVWRFYRMNSEIESGTRIKALLIGSGAAVAELYDEVNENGRYLIRFVSRIDPNNLSVSNALDVIMKGVRDGAQAVVIDTSSSIVASVAPGLYGRAANGTTFIEFASLYEEIFDRVPLEHCDAHQLLQSLPKHRALYDIAKRLFDIVLAIIGSLFAIPFIGIAALLLSMNDGTPFILNERIGKGGRTFRIIKLRSMLFNDQGNPELQKKNRVTSLGRLLRKARVDELPQLWNVLTGDLSFIGPRPELPKIAEVYEREIPQYRMRHLIAPGLSGWAQIHDADAPRGGADIERTKKKVSYDLYYLKHRSFGLDLAIATKTLRTLASFSGT